MHMINGSLSPNYSERIYTYNIYTYILPVVGTPRTEPAGVREILRAANDGKPTVPVFTTHEDDDDDDDEIVTTVYKRILYYIMCYYIIVGTYRVRTVVPCDVLYRRDPNKI